MLINAMPFEILLACGAGVAVFPITLWLVAPCKSEVGLPHFSDVLAALFAAACVSLGVLTYFGIGWAEEIGVRVVGFLLFSFGAVHALMGFTGSRRSIRLCNARRLDYVRIRRDERPWIFFSIVSFELIGSLGLLAFLCAEALGVRG
ncbi:MAG: hypothetical protein RL417_2145 [Pseudomonadota bacterium]|jgi:hypothetical protein